MQNQTDEVPITYRIYTAEDKDETAKLIGKVFAERDPPAVAAGVSAEEFEEFVRLFLPAAAKEGLTVVARLAETGELVGVMLNDDFAADMPPGIENVSEKFDPVFEILGGLDEEYSESNPLEPGEGIHLFLLGVSAKVVGRGVGQELVAFSLKIGRERGYKIAVTEATNLVSQHIFRKFGFEERVTASYADYKKNGENTFESISDQGGPMLMDRQIE